MAEAATVTGIRVGAYVIPTDAPESRRWSGDRPRSWWSTSPSAMSWEIPMQSRLLNDGPQKTFALILQTGDDVLPCITRFAKEQRLGGSELTAIGAFKDVVLGYFDWERKDYKRIPVNEQVEVVSLIGDIAITDGEPALHVHVVIGREDGTVMGGHLLGAHVRPTLEIVITESPAHLVRRHDPESGLALIRF